MTSLNKYLVLTILATSVGFIAINVVLFKLITLGNNISGFGCFKSFVIKADELDEINAEKQQKQKELIQLENNINAILKSNRSLRFKITKLQEQIARIKKLQRFYQKQADVLSEQLRQTKEKRRILLKQLGGFIEPNPSFLDYVRIFVTESKQHGDDRFSLIDTFMTYVIIRKYYYGKIQELNNKEQVLYGQFLKAKQNLNTAINIEKDANKQLQQLKQKYAQIQRALYTSYSRRAALINEITVLSAKAKKIIEQKAAQSGGGGNTIGDSGGSGGGAGDVIPPDTSGKEYKIIVGNQTYETDGPIDISITGGDCSTNASAVPQCPTSYIKMWVYNANKTKNGGEWDYRGHLVIYKELAGAFAVNKISLEEYVLGIGEMPSSWGKAASGKGIEALKSQAVAARTYAYAKYLKGYTLADSVSDQNYVGARKELWTDGNYWVNAVKATQGRILKSNGQVITAYYHSSCGGATLSTQEVWGGYRPYALGISDRYKDSNGKWVPYDKDSPYSAFAWGNADVPMVYLKDLLNASIYIKLHANGNYVPANIQDNVACPLPRKTEVSGTLNFTNISAVQARKCSGGYTALQLANVLGNNAVDKQFDSITKVYATFKDNNGNPAGDQFNIGKDAKYTDSIVIEGKKNGTTKKVYIPAGFFKLAYNLRSPGTNFIRQQSHRGALFDIWQKPGDYSARSYGYGHRVGMCQYGAYGRAKQGQTYVQILSAYYAHLDMKNGLPPQIYTNRGPIVRVKITHPGDALCPSASSCDPSIKNGTYILRFTASKGNLHIVDTEGNINLNIPAGQVVEIRRG